MKYGLTASKEILHSVNWRTVIKDILIIGCNSATAQDKIVWKGSKITLDQVIDLLQFKDHFSETVQAYNSHSTGAKDLHYLKYNTKKKAKSKPAKHPDSNPQPKSTPANPNRTCYRCKAPYSRGHKKVCKALKAKCSYCQEIGHYEKCSRSQQFSKETSAHHQCSSHSNSSSSKCSSTSSMGILGWKWQTLQRSPHAVCTFQERSSYPVRHWQGNQLCQLQSQDRHRSRYDCSEQEYIQKLVSTGTASTIQCHS